MIMIIVSSKVGKRELCDDALHMKKWDEIIEALGIFSQNLSRKKRFLLMCQHFVIFAQLKLDSRFLVYLVRFVEITLSWIFF